jgi:inosose dehydratase
MPDGNRASPGQRRPVVSGARLAAAPISWGVCEVPGWGHQLPSDRVLEAIRSLGIAATEAGADGFLPDDGGELRRALAEHELTLVGGFLPVVLHERSALETTFARARAQVERFARAGGSLLVSAVVVDDAWSPRVPLSDDDWRRIVDGLHALDDICAERGLAQVVHPHAGTLVETRDDVARLLEGSDVSLCLDTGHFAIGGVDSVALARETAHRVGHVHLKDVRADIAAAVRAGDASLRDATRDGLFVPLGDGDAPVAEAVAALGEAGYDGWYVLEQDAVLDDAADADGPTADARRSLEFLKTLDAGRDLAEQDAGGR